MKTSTFNLIASFAAVGLLFANVALADGNGKDKGNNKQNPSHNQNGNHNGNKNCNNGQCNSNGNCNTGNCNSGTCDSGLGGQCGQTADGQFAAGQGGFEPTDTAYTVVPGDTFSTISLKEYGTAVNARFIAQFNRLLPNVALVRGRVLQLPSISATGQLGPAHPAAKTVAPASTTPVSTAAAPAFGATAPTTGNDAVSKATDAVRTKVAVGSELLLDGQTFGDKPGTARLSVSGLSLPITVTEWKTSGVKLVVPTVDLTKGTKADIEVVRADGTIASKTGIELVAPEVDLAN